MKTCNNAARDLLNWQKNIPTNKRIASVVFDNSIIGIYSNQILAKFLANYKVGKFFALSEKTKIAEAIDKTFTIHIYEQN